MNAAADSRASNTGIIVLDLTGRHVNQSTNLSDNLTRLGFYIEYATYIACFFLSLFDCTSARKD